MYAAMALQETECACDADVIITNNSIYALVCSQFASADIFKCGRTCIFICICIFDVLVLF